MPGEPSERIVVVFELVPSWTLAQEQPGSLGKTAASLLDLLSAQDDAKLGLIPSSHSNLHLSHRAPHWDLPAAVADAQCADIGWGHPRCLPLLRAVAPCRQQAQQVLGGSGTPCCGWDGGAWGWCLAMGCCKGWEAPPAARVVQE